MAIDNTKEPEDQLVEETGPALVRPDHDDDEDLEMEDDDFEVIPFDDEDEDDDEEDDEAWLHSQ